MAQGPTRVFRLFGHGIGLSCLALVAFCAPLMSQDSDISGQVVDEGGRPLAGVSVTGMHHYTTGGYSGRHVTTGPDGRYQLGSVGRALFFRIPGYQPLTKLRLPGAAVVDASLHKENPGWTLVRCTPGRLEGQKRYGSDYLFRVPSGVQVEKGETDIDYRKVFVLFPRDHKQRLMIWSGALLGGGFAYTAYEPWYLDGSKISEHSDNGSVAMDIRGTMPTGRRWRSVSWITDIAEYHDVSDEAANFFDQILDSGCLGD